MARLSPTLTAVFFLLSIFSGAIARSDLPELALPESDPRSTSTEISSSNPNPRPEDSEVVRWLEFTKVEDHSKTTDPQKADMVVMPDFPRYWPGRLRHRRGCGHRRRFNHQDRNRQIRNYGNDMISSDERTERLDDFVTSAVEFDPHQHGSRSVSLDKTEFKGPFLHHHHHHDDDDLEHPVKNVDKFSWDKHTPREFDHGHDHHHKRPPFDRDGEEDWHPHHHHHHPHGQDHGGVMILQKLRKFLDHF